MSDPSAAPSPPPPPRVLTPTVRRASWFEPHVRFAWLIALGLLGSALYFTTDGLMTARAEWQLIEHGRRVDALVGGSAHHNRPPDATLDLTFTLDGKPYAVNGVLEGRTQYVVEGSTVPIRVDPQDPTLWTYRTEAPPTAVRLLTPAIAGAACLLVAGFSWLTRRRVLRAYTRGEAWLVRVDAVRNSALAPLSKLANCVAIGTAGGKQVVPVLVPPLDGRAVAKGDQLWVCASRRRAGRVVPLRVLDRDLGRLDHRAGDATAA